MVFPPKSFFRTSGLVGNGGLWALESEAGTEVAPRSSLSVMAARSELSGNATNEFWLNGQTWAFNTLTAGFSAVYGFGPGTETYYGGLISTAVPIGDFRFKLQSGVVHFELPDIVVNGEKLRPFQVPLRVEIGAWLSPGLLLSAGAAAYFYTVDHTSLSSVLATTTQATGVGILSGFALNQFFLKSDFFPTNSLSATVGISSALSAYQSSRVFSLNGKLEWEINANWQLGLEFSLSRTSPSQTNFATGPTLFYSW